MGVGHVRRYFQRPCQKDMGFFKPVQPGQYDTVIGQGFRIIGSEPDGVCENTGSRLKVAMGKQECCQPNLVFGAFRGRCANVVDHRHLCLDGLDKPPCTIVRQRGIAPGFQILPPLAQVYRSQKICTAYR